MLHRTKDLEDYTINAIDGIIGHVKDFYFDDEAWVVRYLVVETGKWLSSRRVLISPIAINQPNWSDKSFPVAITQEQVRNSPNIDSDKPVSRQHEIRYIAYYGYPPYWGGSGPWGGGAYPGMMLANSTHGRSEVEQHLRAQGANEQIVTEAEKLRRQHEDPHLRSCNAVIQYHVHASDGDIGHVDGFLLDDQSWTIRYLIVNTSNWWVGHQVLIAPQWIASVSWEDRKVSVSLTRDAVKGCPPYAPESRIGRDEEARIYDHYGRPGYWAREVKLQNPEFRTMP